MDAILGALNGTNVPTILVLSGIALLFLSLVGKFGTYIEIESSRQSIAAILGGALLFVGIGIQISEKLKKDKLLHDRSHSEVYSQINKSAAYWVIAGSFTDKDESEQRREVLILHGFPAISVDTSDYRFLVNGYFAVIIPVPCQDSIQSMLREVQEIVPDAYLRIQQ